MTTTTTSSASRAPISPRQVVGGRGGALVGTVPLVRFIARRDRLKLTGWILGITLMSLYYANALPQVYRSQEDLRAIGEFAGGVVGALISGPGYGLADPTLESVIVAVYGLYYLLLAALMNILLISRCTRVEEQTGRAELVRASVVGRHAQLTAALVVAVAANIALAVLIAGSFAVAGLATDDALLFGASVAAAGLVFAAVTAVTVQVTEYSRAASGLAGAVLGAAYAVRAAGDALREGGSALSWVSPLAWSQQTRPYADGRWWPLALSLVLAALLVALAYLLSARRDLAAGLVPPRPGSAVAASWLNSPLALAMRLQRAGLIGWGCALVAGGALYGGIGNSIVASFDELPEPLVEVMGGDPSRMLDGYAGTMAFFDALLATIFVILAMQSLRAEETGGRAEPVLATAVGRGTWLGMYTLVAAVGALLLLLVSGLALGVAMAISVGEAEYAWQMVAAHLAFAPAVLLVLALAALLYGLAPRFIGAAWALFGFALIVGFFGPLMELPSWMQDLSPFAHIARLPAEQMRWAAVIVLLVLAAAGAAGGVLRFQRRDLDLK